MSVNFAAQHGAEVNNNGGAYVPGQAYPLVVKLRVADEYRAERQRLNGNRPNLTAIATRMQVSPPFVSKIEKELNSNDDTVLSPEFIRQRARRARGPGAHTLTDFDGFILYRLYVEQPYRLLKSYKEWLFYYTGTVVSTDTISRYLKFAFPHKGSLVTPNLVPLDKYTLSNKIKAYEFINVLRTLSPSRIVFGDEKSIKGEEFWSKKVRRDPITGAVPANKTGSDFRNTYSVTGFCSFNSEKPVPVYFRIHTSTNDADKFFETIQQAIDDGYLVEYDVLVLDNARIHSRRLSRWLWENYKVLLLFLPTRSPEWNPIELVWRSLTSSLHNYPIAEAQAKYGNGKHTTAFVAQEILEGITFDQVLACFKKCFDFLVQEASNYE